MSDGHHTFSQHMSEHYSDDDEAGAALTAEFLAQLARVDVDMRAAWPRMHELVPPLVRPVGESRGPDPAPN